MSSGVSTIQLAADPAVMRLTVFRPRDIWHELDRYLRDLTPILASQEGLVGAWVGRRGASTSDDRAVVSTWVSRSAANQALTVPEYLELAARPGTEIVEARTEVLPVRIDRTFVRLRPMRILRIYRGLVRPGELEAYLAEAAVGAELDGVRPDGPGSLVCATDGPAGFVTASLWPDWPAIESATGGDIHRPLATRNADRLVSGGPTHYELIAEVLGRGERVVAPRGDAAAP